MIRCLSSLAPALRLASALLLAAGSAFAGSPPAEPAAQAPTAPVEIDHVFVWVAPGAVETGALAGAGLFVAPQVHDHVGQGTASRVALLGNVYLELIWVTDAETARKAFATHGDVPARAGWRANGSSPFGIGLRRKAGATGELPFAARDYVAPWMPPGTAIAMAASAADSTEPMVFVLPAELAYRGPAALPPDLAATIANSPGAGRLARLRLTVPRDPAPDGALAALTKLGVVDVRVGELSLVEVTLEGGPSGPPLDLRPALPIVVRR